MSDQLTTTSQQVADDAIDLREMLVTLWKGKWTIIATTFIFTVAAVVYAISLPNVYKSEALLAPVSGGSGFKIPGQLGGLAALAGVNLGSLGGESDSSGLAMEIIKSREFLGRFIEKHDLFIPIMAAEGWNRTDDSLIIDSDIYDTNTKQWVREVKPPFQLKPSVLEVHEELVKLLVVSKDKKTDMITISVEHYSPYLAKMWVDELVKAINEEMRQRELNEAQRSIDYLTKQINETNIADVRTMFYSLIEEQTKTVMLANVREEYVFKTVDPAVVAEKKAKPQRVLIIITAFILGLIFSILGLFIRKLTR